MANKKLKSLFQWRNALFSRNGPPPTTRLVLVTISLYMDADGGKGFPSIRTIAERSGLNRDTIIEHLNLAEREGWIVKNYAGYEGKGWRHHSYIPKIPASMVENVVVGETDHDALRVVGETDHEIKKVVGQTDHENDEGGRNEPVKVVGHADPNSIYSNSIDIVFNSIPFPAEEPQDTESPENPPPFFKNKTPKEEPMPSSPVVENQQSSEPPDSSAQKNQSGQQPKSTVMPWSTPITRKPKTQNLNPNLKRHTPEEIAGQRARLLAEFDTNAAREMQQGSS